MSPEVRIAFLVFLFLSGFLLLLRTRGALLQELNLFHVFTDFLLVPAILLTATTFFMLLFRIDPFPLIRSAAYQLSFQQNVSYADAIPANLEKNLEVTDVEKVDTDGDGFREWVVFYRFDRREGVSPIQVVIYDNDRGNPPVIFPYVLRVPGRDYLGEDQVTFDMQPVTADQNGPGNVDLEEILVKGNRELAIFRFRQNSDPWDFPRDAPPRYQPIGFFRGSGGASFNADTKRVTVLDRNGFERSQLVARLVYELNPATNTYWNRFYEPSELDRELTAPTFTTIDFFGGPPDDILNSAFPEKIVLAFYAATCREDAADLCPTTKSGWNPASFLAANSEALAEFNKTNPAYFGLTGPDFNSTAGIAISNLCYYPGLETDPDLFETGQGRDVVTGEQPQVGRVAIEFVANAAPSEAVMYEMNRLNGQWKIVRRVEPDAATPLCPNNAIQILASP